MQQRQPAPQQALAIHPPAHPPTVTVQQHQAPRYPPRPPAPQTTAVVKPPVPPPPSHIAPAKSAPPPPPPLNFVVATHALPCQQLPPPPPPLVVYNGLLAVEESADQYRPLSPLPTANATAGHIDAIVFPGKRKSALCSVNEDGSARVELDLSVCPADIVPSNWILVGSVIAGLVNGNLNSADLVTLVRCILNLVYPGASRFFLVQHNGDLVFDNNAGPFRFEVKLCPYLRLGFICIFAYETPCSVL